jgi:hypothetical protein
MADLKLRFGNGGQLLLNSVLVVQKGNTSHSAIKMKNRSGRASLRMAKKAWAALAISAALMGATAVSFAAAGHPAGIYMTEIVKSTMLCVGAAWFARNCAI